MSLAGGWDRGGHASGLGVLIARRRGPGRRWPSLRPQTPRALLPPIPGPASPCHSPASSARGSPMPSLQACDSCCSWTVVCYSHVRRARRAPHAREARNTLGPNTPPHTQFWSPVGQDGLGPAQVQRELSFPGSVRLWDSAALLSSIPSASVSRFKPTAGAVPPPRRSEAHTSPLPLEPKKRGDLQTSAVGRRCVKRLPARSAHHKIAVPPWAHFTTRFTLRPTKRPRGTRRVQIDMILPHPFRVGGPLLALCWPFADSLRAPRGPLGPVSS